MIKTKSRSKDTRQVQLQHKNARYVASKHSPGKTQRLFKTVENRNHSNQFFPSSEHLLQQLNKQKLPTSTKFQRKDCKPTQQEHINYKFSVHEGREVRKNTWFKTFIGFKLKKKIQKYLLLVLLVNYSLRLSFQKSQIRKFKLFVGKGNNSKLIKSIFAYRFWWTITKDESEANLVWTQKSRNKIIQHLPEIQKQNFKAQTMNVQYGKRKMKNKKKDSKKGYFDQDLEILLCEKDKLQIKNQCSKQNILQELKSFLKKNKYQKRKQVQVTHNHIQHHKLLTNKKNLFNNLKNYCEEHNDNVFNYVPLTFHVKNIQEDFQIIKQYQQAVEAKKQKEKLLWIVKPGQNSNRGCGIQICKRVEQIVKHIEKQKEKHPNRTFIVQKYINPFLFHRRKFDIRCFALITSSPFISAYFYPIGYIRTSSFEFSIKNCSNKYIHLTNDAIQKKASEYSKYQTGNKVRFEEFQQYLDFIEGEKQVNFFAQILPTIKQLVALSIKSANNFKDSKKQHTFEILGYDFMLDQQLQPWLIQINTNPCLETNCQILNEIIPAMLQNAVKIAVDTVFKPPKIDQWALNELIGCSQKLLQQNKFQLIYSQIHDKF